MEKCRGPSGLRLGRDGHCDDGSCYWPSSISEFRVIYLRTRCHHLSPSCLPKNWISFLTHYKQLLTQPVHLNWFIFVVIQFIPNRKHSLKKIYEIHNVQEKYWRFQAHHIFLIKLIETNLIHSSSSLINVHLNIRVVLPKCLLR